MAHQPRQPRPLPRAGGVVTTYDMNARRRYASRRALIDSIKTERGCVDCGYNAHPEALEFDHSDPTSKAFNVSTNWSRRWEDVLAEIAKCEVRCANCHAVRSKAGAHGRPVVARTAEAPTLWAVP